MNNYWGSWDANGAPVELSVREHFMNLADIQIKEYLERKPDNKEVIYPGGGKGKSYFYNGFPKAKK